jgi:hypothetical protein
MSILNPPGWDTQYKAYEINQTTMTYLVQQQQFDKLFNRVCAGLGLRSPRCSRL